MKPHVMSGSEGVYDAVTDVLSDWQSPLTDKRTFNRRLAEALEEELRDRGFDVPVEHTPRSPCDVQVGDDIGVIVFTDFSRANTVDLRSKSDAIRSNYDELVVFGYALPARDLDRWRMGEFKYEALGLDLDEVTFLRRGPTDDDDDGFEWPSRLWRFAEVVVALLAIVIGVELAVLYQVFGGQAPGAGVTFVAVVALSAVLVYLYERFPV